MITATISGPLPIIALVAVVVVLLAVDLKYLMPADRTPTLRQAVGWSIFWFLLALSQALVLLVIADADSAVEYTTVYLIERTLSLDNLFVFLLIFTYFAVPVGVRPRLLFLGITAALVLRGLAIVVGVALIERFEWVTYVLGVALIALAWRMLQGVEEMDPDRNVMVRATRRVMPVDDRAGQTSLLSHVDGRRAATPLLLALVAMVAADIAFAVDSIPAAFAITDDALIIWAANAFALLGLPALFVLVEELVRRFRYLGPTIAVVLAIVGLKLVLSHVVHVSPVVSLLIVLVAFAVGIALSLLADRRDGSPPAADTA